MRETQPNFSETKAKEGKEAQRKGSLPKKRGRATEEAMREEREKVGGGRQLL